MNKVDLQKKRNSVKDLLDPAFNAREQVIKINTNNTLQHELAKFLLCWEAANDGKRFVTEAIFRNGKRADILVLDDAQAWEILKSERKERTEEKKSLYPVKVIPFKAEEVLNIYKKNVDI